MGAGGVSRALMLCLPHPHPAQHPEDLRWKWASSTLLLAYGQMADKASAHVLPWVDSTLSRLVFYFHYSTWVPARPSWSAHCHPPAESPLPTHPHPGLPQGRVRPPRLLPT